MNNIRLDDNHSLAGQRPVPTSGSPPLTPTTTDALNVLDETNRNINVNSYSTIQISSTLVYQMMSRPRGFCIIINNVDFEDNKNTKRIGSDEDSHRLSEIFTRLYFEVQIKRNIGRNQLLEYLRSMAKHTDLNRHDCLVLIILSHGNSGQFIASDNEGLEFEKVLTIFNNTNCPKLIRKPKMFFFICCRGSTIDFGPQFGGHELLEEDRDVVDESVWPQVATQSDMMICYSTVNGYVSWRNEHNGTWFGSALAQALQNHAHVCELNHILTIASDIVHNRTTRNGAKQAIEWKYRAWTKALYFNPGFHN